MAYGTYIGVTPGSGAKMATGPTYTENANIIQDQKVIEGEHYNATYTVTTGVVSIATANSHALEIMAGASLNVRIRRIEIWQTSAITAAALVSLALYRLTSAGNTGGAVTPRPLDTSDGASGCTALTLPTNKGTEDVLIAQAHPYFIQTIGASTPIAGPAVVWNFDGPRIKPLLIALGTSNGIAIKNTAAYAGANVNIIVYLDETGM